MNKLIGWLFFLASPFSGVLLLIIAGLMWAGVVTNTDTIWVAYGIEGLVWVFLFALWFDGSKYQHALVDSFFHRG